MRADEIAQSESAILGCIFEQTSGPLPQNITRLIRNAPESFDDARHGEIARAVRTLIDRGDLRELARGRSREAWIADFESRREAAQTALSKVQSEFAPLRQEIAAALHEFLLGEATAAELALQKDFARYALPYATSPLSVALRDLSNFILNRGVGIFLSNEA